MYTQAGGGLTVNIWVLAVYSIDFLVPRAILISDSAQKTQRM
jgi:hypothetical protein